MAYDARRRSGVIRPLILRVPEDKVRLAGGRLTYAGQRQGIIHQLNANRAFQSPWVRERMESYV